MADNLIFTQSRRSNPFNLCQTIYTYYTIHGFTAKIATQVQSGRRATIKHASDHTANKPSAALFITPNLYTNFAPLHGC